MPNYTRQELVDPKVYSRLERCCDLLQQIANYCELAEDSAGQLAALTTIVWLQTEYTGRLPRAFEEQVTGQRDRLRAERAAVLGQRPLAHDLTRLPARGRVDQATGHDALVGRAWRHGLRLI